ALPGSHYCGVSAHQELAKKEADLPADAPADTPLATQEEVEQAEPVARVEEPAGEVAVATEAPKDEVLGEAAPEEAEQPEPSIPIERVEEAPEQPETPVDGTGGAGHETTLEGHETVGEVPASAAD